jgi:hypothetical protein
MDKKDLKQDKAMIAKAVHKHERAKHKGKPLTKLAKGGKTNMQRADEGYGPQSCQNRQPEEIFAG